ncbi:YkgJ family cysteine cluster protein [Rhizobium halophytocola]|uniref:Fe-S-cluster containining protein n=1 Tax=Rhizobium halophytocola TaxID=735519 RepID=A0ABS4DWW0_9HYPH|nr:YkgJ family cysteine cluster protein [Rhizobium halophytocola]MBP1850185.1 Fe-S-cluster containining protein [Rhizobium halophytocola]
MSTHLAPVDYDCQACGACCAYDSDWPRFSLETDAELDAIPENLVAAGLCGMRFEGGRCAALSGKLGEHVACTIYALRPLVCRECQPGDPECMEARAALGIGQGTG